MGGRAQGEVEVVDVRGPAHFSRTRRRSSCNISLQVVWETLGNIEGDTEFVDHEFLGDSAGGGGR